MSQNVNVNLTPGGYPKEFHVSQYDVGRQLVAKVVDSTGDYSIPSGATVTLVGTKPSGFGFTLSGTVGSGGVVTFSTTATVTAEYGRIPCEIRITSGDTVLGTANLMLIVEESPHQEGVIDGNSETVIPELTVLVERVEAAASSVLDMQVEADTLPAGSSATYSYDEETNTATFGIPQGEAGAGAAGVVASAYSASSTYAVGDYVIHDSNLYRCTTAVTTAEAFTAAHWTQVVLGDDVSDLKSDLSHLAEEETGLFPASFFVRGQIDNGNNGSYYQNRISFSAMHQYDRPITLNVQNGYNYKVSFYDEGGTYISQYGYRTDTFTIGANQNFKVTIGHTGNVDADHSVPADINALRQVLTYTLQISEDIRTAQGAKISFTLLDVPMEMGNLTNGNNDNNAYNLVRRMRTTGSIPVVAGDIVTNATNGIKYGVHLFDADGKFIQDSGWQTGQYTIPMDGSIRILFVRTDDAVLAEVMKSFYRYGISIETDSLTHLESLSARINDINPAISKAYYYGGEKIDVHKYGYDITALWNFSNPTTSGSFSKQASAYNNGVVFKCFNPDLMQLYEFDTGTKLAEFSIVSGHGDSIDFSNEYYEASDEFPLCYITADTTPAKVYVNRVTRSGATLIRTLIFPSDKTGYYAGHCLDPINNVLYQFGYKNEDYQTTSNGNHIIASKWDLANLNDNGDGTYTPAFIDSFDLPFMNTAQGQVMLNGKVFIMSSNPYVDTGTTEKTKVYVIDVGGQRVSNILTDFIERIRGHEGEGVFFVPNGNKYDMILDIQATGLYKITL